MKATAKRPPIYKPALCVGFFYGEFMLLRKIEREHDHALLTLTKIMDKHGRIKEASTDEKRRLARYIKLQNLGKSAMVLAVVGKRPVGFLRYCWSGRQSEISIDEIYIFKDERGKGYGSKLLRAVTKDKRFVSVRTHEFTREFWFWNGFICLYEIGNKLFMTMGGEKQKRKAEPDVNLSQCDIALAEMSYNVTVNNYTGNIK